MVGARSAGVALVTGASRGIGKATAVALAHAGFDVAITARTAHEGDGRDDSDTGGGRTIPGSLDATAALVESAGRRALSVVMDLLDGESIDRAADTVCDQWGRLDVLVNNAVDTSGGSMTALLDLDLATIERKLSANVVAPLRLTQRVLPHMLTAGGGTVINVTSHVAVNDPPAAAGSGGWGLAYAMTKGAFHRIAGIAAVELGPRGIFAVNVDPGFVVTERMAVNQAALGFEGRYRGAPPSVPGVVIAWLAVGTPGLAREERDALNGTTVLAQRVALNRGLHADWRGS
jgi:NAD(P)-dependent dehydrogenase (short-subunit alcohol dehydrogenase family)